MFPGQNLTLDTLTFKTFVQWDADIDGRTYLGDNFTADWLEEKFILLSADFSEFSNSILSS